MKKDEFVILVDESDQALGKMEKHLAHRLNKKHRAFSVFLIDTDGKLILQRRASGKYHSPDLWTNACCGHPRPNEDTLNAAERRLEEEMGIRTSLKYLFSLSYQDQLDNGMWENEYDHVFLGHYTANDFAADPAEISEIQKVDIEQLENDIARHPERYTFWFKLLLPRIKMYL